MHQHTKITYCAYVGVLDETKTLIRALQKTRWEAMDIGNKCNV
jgi:hypothetical protein